MGAVLTKRIKTRAERPTVLRVEIQSLRGEETLFREARKAIDRAESRAGMAKGIRGMAFLQGFTGFFELK